MEEPYDEEEKKSTYGAWHVVQAVFTQAKILYNVGAPTSNSHCDDKSRRVEKTTKVYAFLDRESIAFRRSKVECDNIVV